MKRKGTNELFCVDGKSALKWKRVAGIVGGTGILAVLLLMAKKLRKGREEKTQSELILPNEDSEDKEQMEEEQSELIPPNEDSVDKEQTMEEE